MRYVGLRALTAALAIGGRSRKQMDWTLLVTTFSTVVTLCLIALYVLEVRGIMGWF
jgi:hypothetical protein